MANAKIGIENLQSAIMKSLNDYNDVVFDGVKKAVDKSASQIKKEIKANAPVGTGKNAGKYRDAWTMRTTSKSSTSYGKVVYAKGSEASLTHLLEKGHALKNGGRARAFPHIAPAEQNGVKTFEQLLEKELKG